MSLVYTFIGDSKGKTSTALGTVLRALGNGQRVRIIFFLKHWETSETTFLEKVRKQFDVAFYKAGDNDFIFVDERTNHTTMEHAKQQLQYGKLQAKDTEDVKHAQMGYMKALSYLEEKPFLLVLDEVNMATSFGLLSVQQVRNLIETARANGTHVVLTGRNPSQEILDESDLITDMRKVKHPFDKGIYAVKGLDF